MVPAGRGAMTSGAFRRWLGEPTLHFLVLGAAVFAAHGWLSPQEDGSPSESAADMRDITIPAEMITALRREFANTTGASPGESDLRALIDDQVEEEMFYREALALGLDRHDLVVRRRLVQIMRFLIENSAAAEEPTEADVRALIYDRPEQYAPPGRTTLTHVFLDRDRHGDRLERDADALLARLRAENPPPDVAVTWGDSFLRGHKLAQSTRDQIAQRIDPRVASAVMELSLGEWSPAIESRYGVHFIWIEERSSDVSPALDRGRDRARRDLVAERRREADREAIEGLRKRYTVHIEWPTEVTLDDAAPQPATTRP